MAVSETSHDPAELLAAGRWAIRCDNRHDLAHDYFVRAVKLAREQDQKQVLASVLLDLSQNFLWHEPPDADSFDPEAMQREALELCEQIGDQPGVARALAVLNRHEESLELCRRIEDRHGVARELMSLCNWAALGGKPRRAKELRDEAVKLARMSQNPEILADTLQSAGINTLDDDAQRLTLLVESADLFRALGYRRSLAMALMVAATSTSEQNSTLAEAQFAEARQLWQELGAANHEANCLDWLADFAEKRGDVESATAMRAESARLSPKPPDHDEKIAEFANALNRFCEATKSSEEE